ncbi:MAG: hypothetical protein AB7P21_08905 [Lautropia sp.]
MKNVLRSTTRRATGTIGRLGATAALSASLALGAALSLHAAPCGAAEAVVVIVNPANPNPVERSFIVGVYTGAIKGWPDGSPVFALDQHENTEARKTFGDTILGKSQANLRAIWSQNIFTGRGFPPKLAAPDDEMKRIVASNRHAIGYILESKVDGTVKVVK